MRYSVTYDDIIHKAPNRIDDRFISKKFKSTENGHFDVQNFFPIFRLTLPGLRCPVVTSHHLYLVGADGGTEEYGIIFHACSHKWIFPNSQVMKTGYQEGI